MLPPIQRLRDVAKLGPDAVDDPCPPVAQLAPGALQQGRGRVLNVVVRKVRLKGQSAVAVLGAQPGVEFVRRAVVHVVVDDARGVKGLDSM